MQIRFVKAILVSISLCFCRYLNQFRSTVDIKAEMITNDHLITILVNSGIAKFNLFKRLFSSSKFVCIYLIVFFEYRIDFTLKI